MAADGTGYGVACGGRWKQERKRDMRGGWAAVEKGGRTGEDFLEGGRTFAGGFFRRRKGGCQERKKGFFLFFCSGPEARGRARNGGFWEVEKLREICGKKPRYGHEFFFHLWFLFLFIIFIGITHKEIFGFLSPNKFFFAEDGRILNAVGAFSGFGLPWNKLGTILSCRLCRFRVFGLNNVFCFWISFGFSVVLGGKGDLGLDAGAFV